MINNKCMTKGSSNELPFIDHHLFYRHITTKLFIGVKLYNHHLFYRADFNFVFFQYRYFGNSQLWLYTFLYPQA